MMKPDCWAVIPAAGIGRRMNQTTPKQYEMLCGKPILQHTLEKLHATRLFKGMVLVLAEDDKLGRAIAQRFSNVTVVNGGTERTHSVINGLNALEAQPLDWVFVHDAVRPCVTVEDILNLHETIQDDPVGGLLAYPAVDTLKQADGGRAEKTLDRSLVWHALTPQAFRYQHLKTALSSALADGLTVTDEASAMEQMGLQPKLVKGRRDNIKITVPSDLSLAEYLLTEHVCA